MLCNVVMERLTHLYCANIQGVCQLSQTAKRKDCTHRRIDLRFVTPDDEVSS